MGRELTKPIKLEEGKSYHIKTPNTMNFKSNKIHIDKVYKNPVYLPHDNWVDDAEELVVYRIYSQRKSWKWFVSPYWELCIWNDWDYEK